MLSWNDIVPKVKSYKVRSVQTRSILLYLFFVLISAIFWCFLTFNNDVNVDLAMPVSISKPKNVHLLAKTPDTLTVTVRGKASSMLKYLFRSVPSLELKFSDYSDGNSLFKLDQAHLKKAAAYAINRNNLTVVSVLPENITVKYTDLPGKKVPVKLDVSVHTAYEYAQNGAWIKSQDTVLVFSDAKTLDDISEVYTYHVEVENVSDTLHRRINIAPVNGAVVEPNYIDVTIPIEEMVFQTQTVPIAVRNAPTSIKVILFPSSVDVSYYAPKSRLGNSKASTITAVVDFNSIDLKATDKNVQVMIGEVPAAYRDVQLAIDSVEYIIERPK